jgi:hypothetical protein
MPPKNKAPKPPADKVGASKITDVVIALMDNDVAPTLEEPTATRSRDGGTTSPHNHEGTLDGDVQDVPLDQDNNEIIEEDEDGEITEQARNLKTLNQY